MVSLDENIVLIATKKPFDAKVREQMAAELESAGLQARILERYSNQQDLTSSLDGVRAIIVRSDEVDKKVFDAARDLKLVVRAGSGHNTIDSAYASERGVYVETTPGQNSNAVAELVIGQMIARARNLARADQSIREGKFLSEALAGTEVHGKRLGIHGFGYIGQLVGRKASSLGMQVSVYDVLPVDRGLANENGVNVVSSPEAVYSLSDFVSLHMPLNQKTRGSVDYKLLSSMKDSGVLINTARPDLVNIPDLVRLMQERPEFKYVVDAEKLEQLGPFKDITDRVFATPKLGAQTLEANANAGLAAVRHVVDGLVHGKFYDLVNNPLPGEMRSYVELAQALGYVNSAFVASPGTIEVVCNGTLLQRYREHFSGYILKGLFESSLGPALTPGEAINEAKTRGIQVTTRNQDPRTIDGNSIEISFQDHEGTRNSLTGRVERDYNEITQIGEFPTAIPISPTEWVIVQYGERSGMADVIGRALTDSGYNKVNGGFRQNPNGDKAMTFFHVIPTGVTNRSVADVVAHNIRNIPGVSKAVYIDMRPR